MTDARATPGAGSTGPVQADATFSGGEGLPAAARWRAMLVVALGIVVSVSTGVMVPVALPAMAQALGIGSDAAVAVVSVYQIMVLVSLLPLASLGTRLGDRRIFCFGLVAFAVGALLSATAQSLAWLMWARGLQGFGAAAISSITPALVQSFWPASRLGRGMGIVTLSVGATAAGAPLAASALLAAGDWPWLFVVSIPVCVLAFFLALRWIPRSPRRPGAFDGLAALLNVLAFGLLMVGIDGLGKGRLTLPVALQLGGACLFLFLLVRLQLRRPRPMLPLDLMRRPMFSLSVGTAVLAFATQMLTFVAVPFLLRQLFELDGVRTALYMSAWPVAAALAAPLAGRLADRAPAGMLGLAGLLVLAGGLALMAAIAPEDGPLQATWRLALCGIGFAFFQAPNNRAIMLSAPAERSNAASGMLAFARLFGQTLGAALAGLLFGLATDGADLVLWLGAALATGAAMASALRLRLDAFGRTAVTPR